MTITITDHSVQNGDTVHIAYRLTEPEKFTGVACNDRDRREYARTYHPASEGVIAFKVAHGQSIRVHLHAWHLGGAFVQSDDIDVHIPYPLDVDAVRAIVRSELEADHRSVDDMVQIIHHELERQANQPGQSPYYDGTLPMEEPVLIDGRVDLRALAKAVINPRNPTT